jgi:sulfur-carrier protein
VTVTLKLFASLAAHLPPDARARHRIDLDIEPGTTVLDVIRQQHIPENLCAIVLIDGAWVARPDRASRSLAEGQVLAIWPPVAGGSASAPREDPGATPA